MRISFASFLIAAALCSSAGAGIISLPDFSTKWNGGGERQSHVASSDQWSASLDDRSGLTAGAPIRITVTTADQFMWLGSFDLQNGELTITNEATLAILLGGQTVSVKSLLVENFGNVTSEGNPTNPNSATTDVAGYMYGPGLPALEIVVPWSTDLSKAVFVFSQVSDISTGRGFSTSGLVVRGVGAVNESATFAVRLTSVPEPSSALLLGGVLLLTAARRRP